MSRQYPIWCDTTTNQFTTNNSYTADKSFGARSYTKTDVLIGSSSSNFFEFVTHETRVFDNEKTGERTFTFLIDGRVFKKATMQKGSREMVFCPLYNGKVGKWGK